MKIYLFLILLIVIATGCVNDAPHDNPLDPDSPSNTKTGSLSGRIIIANQSAGIAGAAIIHTSTALTVMTDSTGNFLFSSLPAGIHTFIVSKSNFVSDSFSIEIRSGAVSQITIGLNGAPVVSFKQILTRKIDFISFTPQYFVDVSASVTDPNGISDLDSVWFGVDTLRFPLSYSVGTKLFSATIEKRFFPTNTIDWLVGKKLHIVSRDKYGAVNISEAFFVSRVIENSAVPIDADTTSSTPLFRWKPPTVTFNYSSTVTVHHAGTELVAWTKSGIISFFEEVQYPTDGTVPPLSQGNYFWTVTMVDDFGNYSRSRESYFLVK